MGSGSSKDTVGDSSVKSGGGLISSNQLSRSVNKIQTQTKESACPVSGAAKHDKSWLSAVGCPHKPENKKSDQKKQQQQQFNVYSQPIVDPTNQMVSSVANQLPSSQQTKELSTERVKSSIPKGNADDGQTWTYPSPQMFYNALARKNKLGDTKEEDVGSVVAMHNNMNEATWRKVLEWERVLSANDEKSGNQPKLLKFMGRPTDLSPKALFKHYVLNHPLPFDRHDWTVIREDGRQVRYVIDYYYDESRASDTEGSGFPSLEATDGTPSLLVDVRPALDSFSLVWGRLVTMPWARQVAGQTNYEYLPLMPTGELKSQVRESQEVFTALGAGKRAADKSSGGMPIALTKSDAIQIAKSFSSALDDCQKAKRKLEQCKSDEGCAKASLDLTICFGKKLCPLQQTTLLEQLRASRTDSNEEIYGARVEAALEGLQACISHKTIRHNQAKESFPEVFAKVQ